MTTAKVSENTTSTEVITIEQQPLARRDDTAQIMEIIEHAANRGEVNTLEKMMDLRDREYARLAKVDFDRDFVAMKTHLPLVARRKKNTQTNSKYAPLEDINKQIDPILARFNFGTSTRIIAQDKDSVTVMATLTHGGGHSIENQLTLPLDKTGIAGKVNKTDVHAIASTVMYCRRIATCALLNISTGDDRDGNRDEPVQPSYVTQEQAMQIDVDLKEAGIDRVQFFEWAKTYDDDGEPVEDSRYILAKNLKTVQTVIATRKAENKKNAGAK